MEGEYKAGERCSLSSHLCKKVEGEGAAAIRDCGVIGEGISDSRKKSVSWYERSREKERWG